MSDCTNSTVRKKGKNPSVGISEQSHTIIKILSAVQRVSMEEMLDFMISVTGTNVGTSTVPERAGRMLMAVSKGGYDILRCATIRNGGGLMQAVDAVVLFYIETYDTLFPKEILRTIYYRNYEAEK